MYLAILLMLGMTCLCTITGEFKIFSVLIYFTLLYFIYIMPLLSLSSGALQVVVILNYIKLQACATLKFNNTVYSLKDKRLTGIQKLIIKLPVTLIY